MNRPSTHARGYDKQWQRLRKQFLLANPLCEFCHNEGRLTPASVVDHILSIEEAPQYRLAWSNLRPLCKPCHDRRTARDQGFNKGKAERLRGVGPDGMPTNPNHPWS